MELSLIAWMVMAVHLTSAVDQSNIDTSSGSYGGYGFLSEGNL